MQELLSTAEWRQIDRLALCAAAPSRSPLHGARRARHRGPGVEFHEYRQYEPGDDLRDVDWTVYGRLERLYIRLARAEAALHTHILLDASGSMAVGVPPKIDCARKIAAAVLRIATAAHEPAGLALLSGAARFVMPAGRGHGHGSRLLEAVAAASAEGAADLSQALVTYGEVARTPGLAIVITDAFAADGGERGLAYLAHRGFDVVLFHVLAPEDLDPRIEGVVDLCDSEGPAGASVAVDAASAARYRRRVGEHIDAVAAYCARLGVRYTRVLSDSPFSTVVAEGVRTGLWRPRS